MLFLALNPANNINADHNREIRVKLYVVMKGGNFGTTKFLNLLKIGSRMLGFSTDFLSIYI